LGYDPAQDPVALGINRKRARAGSTDKERTL